MRELWSKFSIFMQMLQVQLRERKEKAKEKRISKAIKFLSSMKPLMNISISNLSNTNIKTILISNHRISFNQWILNNVIVVWIIKWHLANLNTNKCKIHINILANLTISTTLSFIHQIITLFLICISTDLIFLKLSIIITICTKVRWCLKCKANQLNQEGKSCHFLTTYHLSILKSKLKFRIFWLIQVSWKESQIPFLKIRTLLPIQNLKLETMKWSTMMTFKFLKVEALLMICTISPMISLTKLLTNAKMLSSTRGNLRLSNIQTTTSKITWMGKWKLWLQQEDQEGDRAKWISRRLMSMSKARLVSKKVMLENLVLKTNLRKKWNLRFKLKFQLLLPTSLTSLSFDCFLLTLYKILYIFYYLLFV